MTYSKLTAKVILILAIIRAWRPHLQEHWQDFRLRGYASMTGREIRDLERRMTKTKNGKAHAKIAEQLAKTFPKEHYHSRYGSIFGRAEVSFRINDARLLQLIAVWLRKHGYQIKNVEDDPAYHSRTYAYALIGDPDPGYYGDIAVVAHFNEGGDARCKYVQIDTKHVEATDVPVYELQCDGEAIADAVPVEA